MISYFRWYTNAVIKVVKTNTEERSFVVKFIHWPIEELIGKEFEVSYPFRKYKIDNSSIVFRPLTDMMTAVVPVSIAYKADNQVYQWLVIFVSGNENLVFEVL